MNSRYFSLRSHQSLGYSLIGIMMVVAILGIVANVALTSYQSKSVKSLLDNDAPGAYLAALERVDSSTRLARISTQANATNAAGDYRIALNEWKGAASIPDPMFASKAKPQWLIEIETRDSKKVVSFLKSINVTPGELDSLLAKLTVSPDLNSKEKKKIVTLADWSTLRHLSIIREASLLEIHKNLIDMGASENGLRARHIVLSGS